jgi:hypothetical protein
LLVNASKLIVENAPRSWWEILGLIVLSCSIIGGSSIGTLCNFIPVQTSFAKNAWRSGLNACIFVIPAYLEFRVKRQSVNYFKLLTGYQYLFFLCTLACQVLWTCGLLYASQNLIQSQAYVFNNVIGIFIVVITYFLGTLPSKKEWLGVFFATLGLVFLLLDPSAQRVDSTAENDVVPAIVDIGSAFFGAMYFLLSAHNVKSMPICCLLLMMATHTWLINSLIAKFMDPMIQILSIDMNYGCIGFLNPGNNPRLIASYALLASFFGSAGYVLSLLFYSPLVTSNAFLVEPFFA